MSFSNRIRMMFGLSDADQTVPVLAVMGLVDRDESAAAQVQIALRRTIRILPNLAVIYLAAGTLQAALGLVADLHGLWILALTSVAPAVIATAGHLAIRRIGEGEKHPSRRVFALLALGLVIGALLGAAFGIELGGRSGAFWIPCGIVVIAALSTIVATSSLPVIPGMTAMVDIRTGERSVLSYLLRPMLKSKEALRER